jgi:hypothetical protein
VLLARSETNVAHGPRPAFVLARALPPTALA